MLGALFSSTLARVKIKVLLICLVSASAFGQWNPQKSNTSASLHGLGIINANVVWSSGTGGTFVRTTDGGETWQAGTVPDGEKLDFRDVYAVDTKTAYLMSIGNGNESRIYKTTDTGKTWSLQYSEPNPKAFLDCMAFWNATRGIVVGDAVDGRAELLTTSDGGAHWTPLRPESMPSAKDGEGSPASGTCIATYSKKKGRQEAWHAWFVTENASRVFHTADAGKTWTASEAPLVTGLNQGVFSIAVVDADHLAIVGGDYDHPQMVKPSSAYTDDGGRTWKESSHRLAGYRWCVGIVPHTPGPTAFAVGPTGMDYSIDGGKNWNQMNQVNANTIAFADAYHGWAVGQKGLILKFEGTVPGGAVLRGESMTTGAAPARAQAPAPGTQFRDCSNGCPEMVVLPRGRFVMGAPPGEEDRESVPDYFRGHSVPQHSVAIPYRFAIAKFDVTRDEYAQFVAETKRLDPDSCYGPDVSGRESDIKGANWHSPGFPQTGRDPVVCVNWEDAQAYVAWLSAKTGHVYRLPTEAEWEYVARAGTTTARYGSDRPAELCRYINHGDLDFSEQHPRESDVNRECRDGFAFTSPVGSFPPNQFGLYDMLGNVWQWTEDCWNDNYERAPSDGSSWQTGNCGRRVMRGGAYSLIPALIRSAVRLGAKSSARDHSGGFRVARTF